MEQGLCTWFALPGFAPSLSSWCCSSSDQTFQNVLWGASALLLSPQLPTGSSSQEVSPPWNRSLGEEVCCVGPPRTARGAPSPGLAAAGAAAALSV